MTAFDNIQEYYVGVVHKYHMLYYEVYILFPQSVPVVEYSAPPPLVLTEDGIPCDFPFELGGSFYSECIQLLGSTDT